MGKKAVKQDLVLKGLDPHTAVLGVDGLFKAPPVAEKKTLEVAEKVQNKQEEKQEEEKGKPVEQPRMALVLPEEVVAKQEEVKSEEVKSEEAPEAPKAPKAKKTKASKAEEQESAEEPAVENE